MATDGTGPTPVPDKAEGHVRNIFNVFCPKTLVINIGTVATLHLLCATVAAPWTYKRRPKAYWRRIWTFEPLGPACMRSS